MKEIISKYYFIKAKKKCETQINMFNKFNHLKEIQIYEKKFEFIINVYNTYFVQVENIMFKIKFAF